MVDKLSKKTMYSDKEVGNLVRMLLCLLLHSVFFVNSRLYLSNKFITLVIDIDGLHRLNWVGAVLRETLAHINNCQAQVKECELKGQGKSNCYLIECP